MRKVRAGQVVIETPTEGAEPWIRVTVQLIERRGDLINTVDRYDQFNKRLSVVASELYPSPASFHTHESNVISVYDVAQSIATVVVGWLIERYGGTVDAEGNVILEN